MGQSKLPRVKNDPISDAEARHLCIHRTKIATTGEWSLADAVVRSRKDDEQGRIELIAALTWVAFSAPDATGDVYDTIAAAWLDNDTSPVPLTEVPAAPLGPDFWNAYWRVVDGAEAGYDATTITQAVASLGGAVDPTFGEIAEAHAQQHPGADNPHLKDMPGMTDIAALGELTDGSLGKSLYDLLTKNGFDAEVLDRDAIKLADLPPALRYLNTRILQMHDVWHLAAGYTTNAIHEVAISAFQLAQFGHNYSAMFLAIATRSSHERNAGGFRILMQSIT